MSDIFFICSKVDAYFTHKSFRFPHPKMFFPTQRARSGGKRHCRLGLNPERTSGFAKLRAYARQIASRTAEGVAGYDETVREGR